MNNREYFNLLRVTDKFPKEQYNKKKFKMLLDSTFSISNIHRRFEDSGEFSFKYTIDICYKWAGRFKRIEDFDMRIIDKMIDVSRFRREVMGYKTSASFKTLMLSEDFIENSVDEVLRYISLINMYNGLTEIYLNKRRVLVRKISRLLTLQDTESGEMLGEDIQMIVFKGDGYRLVKEIEMIKNGDYDFVILGSKNLSKYIQ